MAIFGVPKFPTWNIFKAPLTIPKKPTGEWWQAFESTPLTGISRAKFPSIAGIKKVPVPSLKTTAKVTLGGGTIATGGYTLYKGSEAIGRWFETGTTKKDVAIEAGKEGDKFPPGFGAGDQPTINIYPPEGFWGGLGAGAGKGLGGVGTGVGSGMGIALPIVAVGAIILLAMKEKKKR